MGIEYGWRDRDDLQLTNMKTIFILFAALALAVEPPMPPMLSKSDLEQLRQIAAAIDNLQLRQQLIVVKACGEVGIKPSECRIDPDGRIVAIPKPVPAKP